MGWADAPPPPYSAVAPDQPPPSYTPNMSAPAPMRRESSISEPAGRAISLQERREYLAQSGLPLGIQEAMLESLEEFPLRIWIIDNSGSMSTRDGTYLEQSGRSERMVDCTRWQELGASIQWHATMAAHLAAPTEFRLLNPPGGGSLQVLQCGVGPEPTSEIREVEKMLHTSPKSTTPLCAQIRAVVERVKQEEQVLRAKGRRCVVVIASDGQASDGDVEAALRPLCSLPVWLVVRLCTDEDQVVEYWNEIDEHLEKEIDVIDDHAGEAAEVNGHNPWLTYGAPLHRLREWGSSAKVLDFLDERPLSRPELCQIVGLIWGRDAAATLPSPSDWSAFKGLETLRDWWHMHAHVKLKDECMQPGSTERAAAKDSFGLLG